MSTFEFQKPTNIHGKAMSVYCLACTNLVDKYMHTFWSEFFLDTCLKLTVVVPNSFFLTYQLMQAAAGRGGGPVGRGGAPPVRR